MAEARGSRFGSQLTTGTFQPLNPSLMPSPTTGRDDRKRFGREGRVTLYRQPVNSVLIVLAASVVDGRRQTATCTRPRSLWPAKGKMAPKMLTKSLVRHKGRV